MISNLIPTMFYRMQGDLMKSFFGEEEELTVFGSFTGEVGIAEIRGSIVDSRTKPIRIEQIGMQGTVFYSDLRLPMDRGVVLKLLLNWDGHKIALTGTLTKREIIHNLYRYTVELHMNPDKLKLFIEILDFMDKSDPPPVGRSLKQIYENREWEFRPSRFDLYS